jgi:hypothetical protein
MRSDIVLGGVMLIMTILGGIISAHAPQKQWQRWLYAASFIALGIVGMVFVVRVSNESVATSKEATLNTLGDAEHPPWVAVISMPRETRFIVTNNSDYPAYISGIDLIDDTAGDAPKQVRKYGYQELSAQTARMDDGPWTPPADNRQRHFTAVIDTRAGLFNEEMMLALAGNNQWARAVRVRRGMRTLEEDIDRAWPRNQKSEVEWKR